MTTIAARVVVLVAVAAVVVLVIAWLGQRRLIYFPTTAVPAPAEVGVPFAEPLRITTADGVTLRSWFVPAEGEPVGAVLVLPGNAGTRAGRAPLAVALRRLGLATLLVDYRGYGGSEGTPSQDGLLADARAATAALAERTGLPDDRIVYFGESLGSAVAAGLAAERPPAALILRSPFPDLASVGARAYPWLPVRWLLRDRYPTTEWLAQYQGPTLVVAGGADTLIPPDLSAEVAAAAPGPTEVVTVPDTGHNDRALLDGAIMLAAIESFLAAHTDV